jgi:hypothetical protein
MSRPKPHPKPHNPTGSPGKVSAGDSEDEAGTYAEDQYGKDDTGESDAGVVPHTREKIEPGSRTSKKIIVPKP